MHLFIDLYLSEARPVLLASGTETSALWISSTAGRPFTKKNLGSLISKLTRETLGVDVSPHLFRTAAATTAAAYAPHLPHLASAILGHSDPRITEEHYNRASSVQRAVSDPSAVLKGIGEPKRAEVQKLYHAPDLTILDVIWGPIMTIMPHNHQMWAVIGIYSGREDNVFWRRLPDGSGKVEPAGARALCVGDAEPLGHNIIHSVTNPISRFTGAIHVYGGDFFAAERSEWDPETLQEARYDVAKNMKLFEDSNALARHFAVMQN